MSLPDEPIDILTDISTSHGSPVSKKNKNKDEDDKKTDDNKGMMFRA